MNANVNTTANEKREAARIDSIMKDEAKQMKRIYAAAPKVDIEIFVDKDDPDKTVQGGINGVFFTYPKGRRINDVPLPIVETLEEAGYPVSRKSGLKFPPKPASPVLQSAYRQSPQTTPPPNIPPVQPEPEAPAEISGESEEERPVAPPEPKAPRGNTRRTRAPSA